MKIFIEKQNVRGGRVLYKASFAGNDNVIGIAGNKRNAIGELILKSPDQFSIVELVPQLSEGLEIGRWPAEAILSMTGKGQPRQRFIGVDQVVYEVKMTSLRYQCFLKSKNCLCCGIEGKYMILTRNGNGAHFNLYAEKEGALILMTKDHIVPKSKGGADHIDNLQTLCTHCNNKKSDQEVSLSELRLMQTN